MTFEMTFELQEYNTDHLTVEEIEAIMAAIKSELSATIPDYMNPLFTDPKELLQELDFWENVRERRIEEETSAQ